MTTRGLCYLVDDDPAVLDALSVYLEEHDVPVQVCASARDFLSAFTDSQPSCLVADVKMPGMTGLELQEHLNKNHIDIPVLFITGHGDVAMAVKAIKAGAQDFFEKPFDNRALLNSIQLNIRADAERRENEAQRQKILDLFGKLTSREREVMALVSHGSANKQIATRLGLSPRTIEVHRARVMEKMSAESLSDLISKAVICGVHDIPAR